VDAIITFPSLIKKDPVEYEFIMNPYDLNTKRFFEDWFPV